METTKTSVKTNKMPAVKKSATPAEDVKVVKTKVAKESKPVAAAVVSVPVVAAPAEAVEAAPAETRSTDVVLQDLLSQLKTLGTEVAGRIRDITKAAAEAGKTHRSEVRNSKRKVKKDPATMTPEERAKYDARLKNNALLVPRPLTDSLCAFMSLPSGSSRAWSDVTKFVSAYNRTHNSSDPAVKGRVNPTPALAKLLGLKDGEVLTHRNIQTKLKSCFKVVPKKA